MEAQEVTYLNPVEALERQYERDGQVERGSKRAERGVIRASSLGSAARRLMFNYFPDDFPEEAIQGRGCRVFEVGDQRHDSLRQKLSRAGLKGRIPATKAEEQVWEVPIEGTDWVLRGHPDGILTEVHVKGITYGAMLLEIKTTGSFGWRDVIAGVIDPKHLAQAAANCAALGLENTYFLYERKDTQHLCEVIVPFDPAVLDRALVQVRQAILAIEAGMTPLDVPACEGEYYGWQMRRGTKASGPFQALGWRCSYCPYVGHCFPSHVQWLSGGKPVCTAEETVPHEAVVVSMGKEVIPRADWKLSLGEEEGE